MKNKKKKIITIICIVLIVVFLTGGILAYLTSTDHKTNIFTVGSIKISLTEPNWNPSSMQDFLPGDTISKNPIINNIGRNQGYVYIKVVNPIITLNNGEGPLFSYTINSGWTQLDEKEHCGYRATTYYYNTALNPSSSTNALFDTVTINDFSGDIGEEQLLDIYAYGIQSTYLESGSTVTSIFSDSFTTTLSDTNEKCPSALDCSNNEMYTTAPSNLKGLAKIMAKNAYLDNGKSEYVNSCSGVNFSNRSSNTNGKGIYEIASTKNDPYPIYYYRGDVENNNVKFVGFCWKAIITTDTGGVKMIYNGAPDGSGNCTNTTGESTQIGTGPYNMNNSSQADLGYMYGTRYLITQKSSSSLATPYVYGGDVTYSNGTYTLTNTMTSTGTWSNDYKTLNSNHYTCFSTGTSCTSVYYVYYADPGYAYYITLTSGKKVEDALNEMFSNTTNSNVKTQVDTWYSANLSSYTSYIEDTVYCNDRSISELNGFNPNGGDIKVAVLDFSPYIRLHTTRIPSLICSRVQDRFTVSSSKGNGALTYPVGLITNDEVMYAGGYGTGTTTINYLNTNLKYWTNSPLRFETGDVFGFMNFSTYSIFNINSLGSSTSNSSVGFRPVISLASTALISSGDGTSTNPYVISTN